MHPTKTLCTRLSAAALVVCTLITPALAAPGTVTAQDGLRLRAGSNTSSQILDTLAAGTAVEVLEAVDDSWYRVSVDGRQGYVSSKYISLDTAGEQPAPEPQAPAAPEAPTQPEPPVQPEPLTGTITASSLNIRSGPASSYGKVGTLSQGTQVTLLELTGDWYRIEQGYISAQYVEFSSTDAEPEPPKPLVGIVTASSLNIRSGPASSYSKAGVLTQGTQVELLERKDDWYRIEQGYISAQYVEVTAGESQPAAPAQPSTPAQPETPAQPAAPARRTGLVTASSLNVRSGPGSGYDKVSVLSSGAQVELLEQVDGWYRIDGGYISAQYISILDSNLSELQAQIVAYAHNFLGCDYVLGGNGPKVFDCSGLTKYVYNHFGYSLYRGATQQLKNGVTVSKENLQPGDLVFFNSAGTGASRATHVGIYIGDGQFLHASSPKVGVVISDLYSAYYKSVYTTARRIV